MSKEQFDTEAMQMVVYAKMILAENHVSKNKALYEKLILRVLEGSRTAKMIHDTLIVRVDSMNRIYAVCTYRNNKWDIHWSGLKPKLIEFNKLEKEIL